MSVDLTARAQDVLVTLRASARSIDADLLRVIRDGMPIVRNEVQARCRNRQSASRVLGRMRTRGAELGILVSRWRWEMTPLAIEAARLLGVDDATSERIADDLVGPPVDSAAIRTYASPAATATLRCTRCIVLTESEYGVLMRVLDDAYTYTLAQTDIRELRDIVRAAKIEEGGS